MRSVHTNFFARIAAAFVLLGAMHIIQPTEAFAQEPFIGEIRPMGFNFCPRGWAPADGQLLPIAQNTALFSLYGTNYGGDGRTTFGLPDLRGRAAIHMGQGPGLQNYRIGAKGGAETVTLNSTQIPSHTHPAMATATEGFQMLTQQGPTNGIAMRQGGGPQPVPPPSINVTIGNTGGNQAHENRAPYQVIRYCVALVGIFPSRN